MAGREKEYKEVDTPLMKQYYSVKRKYPDAIVLFRVGDFYETFGDDAIKTSHILGIVLTRRHNGTAGEVELAGFPYHALDNYLPRLVRAGHRVAICEQLEDPKLAKKVVKRGVTELISPGVAFSEQILERKSNNYLAALYFDKKQAGISLLDVSTGEFLTASGSFEYIGQLLQIYTPKEIIIQREHKNVFLEEWGNQFYYYLLDDWVFQKDYAYELLTRHFETTSLKGFGIENDPFCIISSAACLHYVKQMQQSDLKHITSLQIIPHDQYVWLDSFTLRNLEIVHSPNENAKTLLSVLDYTCTPMGGRKLKNMLLLPLKDVEKINYRLDRVHFFYQHPELCESIRQDLKQVADIERLTSKIVVHKINPRELLLLAKGLTTLSQIIDKIGQYSLPKAISGIISAWTEVHHITDKINNTLYHDPPVQIGKGVVIAEGVNEDLDEWRNLIKNGQQKLLELQQQEIQRTGIPSLKIAFNNVFGYYIEVRNTHREKVPADWVRKQTLTQAERYITRELKEWEEKILGAEERIVQLEQEIYGELLRYLNNHVASILNNAQVAAKIDVAVALATAALKNHYVRPEINDAYELIIENGRHPVIEQQLPPDQPYIPNDLILDNEHQQIIVITGPNMSGKSAYLRQNALIVLMAQVGSFVPASFAKIGIVDKIFTRVGASDNISRGESTFMVEMIETAGILNNMTSRSFVILDEIGRGTSTYDGISIAQAIAEYIHDTPGKQAKTLFATHYHELNELEKSFPRIKNYNVAVKEEKQKVIFLHKLQRGGSEHSFGIHVAKMAGVPMMVVQRANEILHALEAQKEGIKKSSSDKETDYFQLSFIQLDDPLLEEIREELRKMDINTITPVEALLVLSRIKNKVGIK